MRTQRIFTALTALVIALTALASVSACAQDNAAPAGEAAAAPEPEASTAVLTDDNGRANYAFGYAVGMQLGELLKRTGIELDSAVLFPAIEDAVKNRKPALSDEEMQAVSMNVQQKMKERMESQAGENLKAAEEFLAKNASAEGVVTTASGLQYIVETPGSGEKPTADSKVRVHYKGSLLDGTEFDSSYKRGEPAEFKASQVIKGWTEALQLMPVGAKYKLFIPPALGYGPQGNQRIPGNSLLIFEVELLEIVPEAAAGQSTLIQ